MSFGNRCFLCLAPMNTLDFPEGDRGLEEEGKSSSNVMCRHCYGIVFDRKSTNKKIEQHRLKRPQGKSRS